VVFDASVGKLRTVERWLTSVAVIKLLQHGADAVDFFHLHPVAALSTGVSIVLRTKPVAVAVVIESFVQDV
jgi:hypothetical protein